MENSDTRTHNRLAKKKALKAEHERQGQAHEKHATNG